MTDKFDLHMHIEALRWSCKRVLTVLLTGVNVALTPMKHCQYGIGVNAHRFKRNAECVLKSSENRRLVPGISAARAEIIICSWRLSRCASK